MATVNMLEGPESRKDLQADTRNNMELLTTEPDHQVDQESNHLYLKDIKTFMNLKKAARNCIERKRQISLQQDIGK